MLIFIYQIFKLQIQHLRCEFYSKYTLYQKKSNISIERGKYFQKVNQKIGFGNAKPIFLLKLLDGAHALAV